MSDKDKSKESIEERLAKLEKENKELVKDAQKLKDIQAAVGRGDHRHAMHKAGIPVPQSQGQVGQGGQGGQGQFGQGGQVGPVPVQAPQPNPYPQPVQAPPVQMQTLYDEHGNAYNVPMPVQGQAQGQVQVQGQGSQIQHFQSELELMKQQMENQNNMVALQREVSDQLSQGEYKMLQSLGLSNDQLSQNVLATLEEFKRINGYTTSVTEAMNILERKQASYYERMHAVRAAEQGATGQGGANDPAQAQAQAAAAQSAGNEPNLDDPAAQNAGGAAAPNPSTEGKNVIKNVHVEAEASFDKFLEGHGISQQ